MSKFNVKVNPKNKEEIIVKFVDGTEVKGLVPVVSNLLLKMGVEVNELNGKFYNSSSQGLIPISAMPTEHIRNAMLKQIENKIFEMRSMPLNEFMTALYYLGIGDEEHNFRFELLERLKKLK